MRRDKKFWRRLTPFERRRLVELERADNAHSIYLPDDCSECGGCGIAVSGDGLCRSCSKELHDLLEKANNNDSMKCPECQHDLSGWVVEVEQIYCSNGECDYEDSIFKRYEDAVKRIAELEAELATKG